MQWIAYLCPLKFWKKEKVSTNEGNLENISEMTILRWLEKSQWPISKMNIATIYWNKVFYIYLQLLLKY